jgi:hypothetical protein
MSHESIVCPQEGLVITRNGVASGESRGTGSMWTAAAVPDQRAAGAARLTLRELGKIYSVLLS